MNAEKVGEVIEKIAGELRVPAEMLYQSMVENGFVAGVKGIIVAAISCVAVLVCGYIMLRFRENCDEPPFVVAACMAMFYFVGIIGGLCQLIYMWYPSAYVAELLFK